MAVEAFVRFTDVEGFVHYGAVSQQQLGANLKGSTVDVLSGNPWDGLRTSNQKKVISKVL